MDTVKSDNVAKYVYMGLNIQLKKKKIHNNVFVHNFLPKQFCVNKIIVNFFFFRTKWPHSFYTVKPILQVDTSQNRDTLPVV